MAEDRTHAGYFTARLPDGVPYREVLPSGVQGFDVTFIPASTFDAFWMIWFFPDARSAHRYYDWGAIHNPSPRQVLRNAVGQNAGSATQQRCSIG